MTVYLVISLPKIPYIHRIREVQPVPGPEKINMISECPVEAAQSRSGEPGKILYVAPGNLQ